MWRARGSRGENFYAPEARLSFPLANLPLIFYVLSLLFELAVITALKSFPRAEALQTA